MYDTVLEFEYNGNTFAIINHHGQLKVLSYASDKMVILTSCRARPWIALFEDKEDKVKAMHAAYLIQEVMDNETNGVYTVLATSEWVAEVTGIPIERLGHFTPSVPVSFKLSLVEAGEDFIIVEEGGDEDIKLVDELMTFRT